MKSQPIKKKGKKPAGAMEQLSKITVELEFDDPVFIEIYTEIAKLKGIPLGRLVGLELQGSVAMYRDTRGILGDWLTRLLKDKEDLVGYSEDLHGAQI